MQLSVCLACRPAVSCQDRDVFSFNLGDAPCSGLDTVLTRYRSVAGLSCAETAAGDLMMEVALANTVSAFSANLLSALHPANQESVHKQTAFAHYAFVRITLSNPAEACLNKHCRATRYFSSWQQGAQQEADELILCILMTDD